MRQEFTEKLQACGTSKEKLQILMASLDEEKRSLKSRLSRLSSEPEGRYSRGRERQVQIRKIKDRNSFLTEEREVVRAKLGSLKLDKKALNRAANQRNIEFCHAFVAAAERVLPEDDILAIEMKASEMLTAGS